MRSRIFFTLLGITQVCFYGCKHPNTDYYIGKQLVFSNSIDTFALSQTEKKDKVIYYFEGNCSMCYITLKMLKDKFKDRELVGITSSSDTAIILFQLELQNISATLLFDPDSLFYKENKKLMDISDIFLINSFGNIEQIPKQIN